MTVKTVIIVYSDSNVRFVKSRLSFARHRPPEAAAIRNMSSHMSQPSLNDYIIRAASITKLYESKNTETACYPRYYSTENKRRSCCVFFFLSLSLQSVI